MKIETIYFWRIQGPTGRWTLTRYRATEKDIRDRNPQARSIERVEHDSISFEVGETQEEIDQLARKRSHSSSDFEGRRD